MLKTTLKSLSARAFVLVLMSCNGNAQSFTSSVQLIDQARCQRMQKNGVIGADSPVPCSRLRLVQFPYVDFEGVTHYDGEIVVMDAVAQRVKIIFEQLLARKFPLAKALGIEHYRGDDDASMADNNTCALNDRAITSGSAKSIHAYGLAIDVNPIQNPYIAFGEQGTAQFKPAAGSTYANRLNIRPAKPERAGLAEEVIDLFADNGFLTWGGYWDRPIDYQHFQVSNRAIAERLAQRPFNQAQRYFEKIIGYYLQCKKDKPGAARRAACVERTEKEFS